VGPAHQPARATDHTPLLGGPQPRPSGPRTDSIGDDDAAGTVPRDDHRRRNLHDHQVGHVAPAFPRACRAITTGQRLWNPNLPGALGFAARAATDQQFRARRSAPARKVAESNAWSANSSIPGCSRFSSRRARWASSRSPGWPMAPPITAQRRASFRAPREATRRAYTRRGAQRRAGQRLPRLGRGPNDTIQLQDHTNRSLYGSLEITQAIARHVFKERGRPGLPACVGPVGSSQPIKRERPAHHWPSSASNTLISAAGRGI
jgi:hypothetical protein